MYNRADVVDQNFRRYVREGRLPSPKVLFTARQAGLHPEEAVDLFESQLISRHLDLRARKLKETGHCYYTIGSSGHEGNAVFGKVFKTTDMSFLHYRSGAFFVQRTKQVPGTTPIYDMLLSFTASREDPISGGRHKVFGSRELLVPPQTSTIASHLPKAVGAALSVRRASELGLPSVMPSDAVVTCSFGDASANHSTALGAFNTAGWVAYQYLPMPIVFICEDNQVGISVPTPERWVEAAFSNRPAIQYIKCDGRNLLETYYQARRAEILSRTRRVPVFLHMECVRLLGHAGSDVESTYHTNSKIEATEFDDPLLHSARCLIENNWMSGEEILRLYESIEERVQKVSEKVILREPLKDPVEVESTITSCTEKREVPPLPSTEARKWAFQRDFKKLNQPYHMARLINWGLTDILLRYKNTLVFGEDVAQKGGVYHVTDGLYKRFGSRRVFNSPLDEQTIIGGALGFAHNGFVPIPEVQFLAYVHNAEDQIRGEASTLAFFSKGQFTNPMVLRVAGLAYQKGFGGHFHNDNSLAVFRDIPGIVIAIPATGADAVKMLRTSVREAHQNGRVVVFIEPIARYMTKDLHEEGDRLWMSEYPEVEEEIPLGEIATYGEGEDLCLLTYGNGVYYSRQAQKVLEEQHGIKARIIDLRWVAPLNREAIVEAIGHRSHVLIVEECRKTGSLSEGLVAMIHEEMVEPPRVQVLAARDSFIPLGPAAAAGLPKKDEVVQASLELLRKGRL